MSPPSTPPPPSTEFWSDPTVGDLLIRSSDGIDFHVHKDIMSRESPFFSTMLTLPQSCSGDSKPVVDAQEDSRIWSNLIPLCYVPTKSGLDDLPLLGALLEAARKYQMGAITRSLHNALLQPAVVSKSPLSVYALGCAYGLYDVARIAARHSLRTPIYFEYVDELELITLRTFHNLSDYRRRCSVVARRVTSWHGWLSTPSVLSHHLEVSCTTKSCRKVVRAGVRVRQAWATYVEKLDRIFESTPDPDRACDAALLDPVINSVKEKECAQCARTIRDDVARFSEAVRGEVERAVAAVELIS